MPMKKWFRQLQPMQLYIILALTLVFFVAELVVSHVTHAITLLLDSYHTLCNILALSACMITLKHVKTPNPENETKESKSVDGTPLQSAAELSVCFDKKRPVVTNQGKQQEKKLKNTFGWARIDVIGMLICYVFLASLSFSILVEALQTLVHIDHHDEMHHPIPVLCLGVIGLILNGVCYLVIGGYTFHQSSFLYMNENGCVMLNRVVTSDAVYRGERRLSRTRTVPPSQYRQRQGCREMFRDVIGKVSFYTRYDKIVLRKVDHNVKYVEKLRVGKNVPESGPQLLLHHEKMYSLLIQSLIFKIQVDMVQNKLMRTFLGCIFVIICALLVYLTQENVAKYVDPIISMVSATALLILSFPYMKESCLILLQTIPDTINIDSLRSQLIQHFPDIVNVHDLHVWQFTATKVISTAHIIFKNPTVYLNITDKLSEFFLEHGITQVTIQPEFFTQNRERANMHYDSSSTTCLMPCQSEGCKTSHCCPDYLLQPVATYKPLTDEVIDKGAVDKQTSAPVEKLDQNVAEVV